MVYNCCDVTLLTLTLTLTTHACTCVNDLRDVCLGRHEQDDVVERYGADEVEEEPGLQVVLGDLARVQDDLVREVIGDDSCNTDSLAISQTDIS